MMDSPESLIGETSVQGSRDAVSAFQNHTLRWNAARKGDEDHLVSWNTAREGMSATTTTTGIGADRRTAFPSHAQEVCEARTDMTHLADAALVPCSPGESKWLGILVLRTQELGECVS